MKDTTIIKTLPGILSPMKRDEYDADTTRLRSTALKDLVIPEQGPAAYYRKHELRLVEDEDKRHLVIGDLLHGWILEGKKNWVVAPMVRNKTHVAYKEFLDAHKGKVDITAKEERDLCNWREGIFRSPEARRVLELPRYEEQVILWEIEVQFVDDYGEVVTKVIKCKAAIDVFPYSEIKERGTFRRYDLKSDAGMKSWDRVVFDLGYHQQAAWYEWGVESLPMYSDKPSNFSHIVVEKKAPFWCYVRPLSESALRYGRNECELAIERFCECTRRQELYVADGKPAIDAWPDHKERQQLTPVEPSDFYKTAYGLKHSEPVPTSHTPVAYDEENDGSDDIPESVSDFYRARGRAAG